MTKPDDMPLPWQRYSPLGIPEPEVCYLVPSSEARALLARIAKLEAALSAYEQAANLLLHDGDGTEFIEVPIGRTLKHQEDIEAGIDLIKTQLAKRALDGGE